MTKRRHPKFIDPNAHMMRTESRSVIDRRRERVLARQSMTDVDYIYQKCGGDEMCFVSDVTARYMHINLTQDEALRMLSHLREGTWFRSRR